MEENKENKEVTPQHTEAKKETIGIGEVMENIDNSIKENKELRELKPGTGFTIAEAKEAARNGFKVTHKTLIEGAFVFAQVPSFVSKDYIHKMSSLPQSVKDEFRKRTDDPTFTGLKYKNQFALVKLDSSISGFSFEVLEGISNDWIILD